MKGWNTMKLQEDKSSETAFDVVRGKYANEINKLISSGMIEKLAFIWGAEWMAAAIIEALGVWITVQWPEQLITLIAVLLSFWLVVRNTRRIELSDSSHNKGDTIKSTGNSSNGIYTNIAWLLPLLTVTVIAIIVIAAHQLGFLSFSGWHLLRGFTLAALFVFIGSGKFSKRFLVLGIWLALLTFVVSVWYMGYASVVIGFFGGMGLFLAGRMLSGQAKQAV
jgi:hypothetical protein